MLALLEDMRRCSYQADLATCNTILQQISQRISLHGSKALEAPLLLLAVVEHLQSLRDRSANSSSSASGSSSTSGTSGSSGSSSSSLGALTYRTLVRLCADLHEHELLHTVFAMAISDRHFQFATQFSFAKGRVAQIDLHTLNVPLSEIAACHALLSLPLDGFLMNQKLLRIDVITGIYIYTHKKGVRFTLSSVA
jgi:hypothetical protein